MQPGDFYLDETNLVGDVQSINISGELDVGLLVAIGAIHYITNSRVSKWRFLYVASPSCNFLPVADHALVVLISPCLLHNKQGAPSLRFRKSNVLCSAVSKVLLSFLCFTHGLTG